jgi:hypothetical protein
MATDGATTSEVQTVARAKESRPAIVFQCQHRMLVFIGLPFLQLSMTRLFGLAPARMKPSTHEFSEMKGKSHTSTSDAGTSPFPHDLFRSLVVTQAKEARVT